MFSAGRPKTADADVRQSLIAVAGACAESVLQDEKYSEGCFAIDLLGVDQEGKMSSLGREDVPFVFVDLEEDGLEAWAVALNNVLEEATTPVFQLLQDEREIRSDHIVSPSYGVCGFLISVRLPRVLASTLVPEDYSADGEDVIHQTWRWDAALPGFPLSFEYRLKLECQFDTGGFLDAYSSDVLGTCWQIDEAGKFVSGQVAESFCLGAVFGAESHESSPGAASFRMDLSLKSFRPMAEAWTENGLEQGISPADLSKMRPIMIEPVFVNEEGSLTLPNLPQTAARALAAEPGTLDVAGLCQSIWTDNRASGCDALIVTLDGPTKLKSKMSLHEFSDDDILSFWVSPSLHLLRVTTPGTDRDPQYYMLEQGFLVDIAAEAGD